MDAFLLAAGLGTRLRPLTHSIPKALVPVAGVPMLERVARRVIDAGADRLVINVHHHAEQIVRFVEGRDGFGVDVRFSHEPGAPLDTGGGLLHALPHLRRDTPWIVHNTDIVTDFELRGMLESHQASGALATLAVNRRDTARYVEFDNLGLRAVGNADNGYERAAREPAGELKRFGFCGVHVVSPKTAGLITEHGTFGIFDLYLRLVGEGLVIRPFDIGAALWRDIGTIERLRDAEKELRGQGQGQGQGQGEGEGEVL